MQRHTLEELQNAAKHLDTDDESMFTEATAPSLSTIPSRAASKAASIDTGEVRRLLAREAKRISRRLLEASI